jgi:site-specific DNA recombinase
VEPVTSREGAVRVGYKIGAGYLRESTEELAKEGRFGLARQRNEVEAYAARNRIWIEEWYVDVISGRKDSRKELSRLRAEKDRYQCVVAPAVDRLGRTMPVQRKVLAEILSLDLEPHVTSIGLIDPDDRHNLLRFNLEGLVAEYELFTIRDRMHGAKVEAARAGKMAASFGPYGYRVRWEIPESGGKREKTIEIHETEAAVVREMFEEIARGKPPAAVTVALRERGVRPARGRNWWAGTIRKMIKNPFYKGRAEIRFKRPAQTIAFPVPAIVTAELWEQANRGLTTRKPWGRRSVTLPLAGILRCGDCGHPMVARITTNGKSGRQHRYYQCLHSHRTGENRGVLAECVNRGNWRADDVDRAVRSHLEAIALDASDLLSTYQEDGSHARRLSIATRLKKLAGDEERFLEDYAEGITTGAVYKRLVDRLADERAQLEGELLALASVPELDLEAAVDRIRAGLAGELPLGEIIRANDASVSLSASGDLKLVFNVPRGQAAIRGSHIRNEIQDSYLLCQLPR